MVLLIASLFWALWDEGWAQRHWITYQKQWKERYGAFLKTAKSKSARSVSDLEKDSDYQKLEQAARQADAQAKPHREELQKQITDLSAKVLAVQNVFTDKRAYVNYLTYDIETESSASGKESLKKDLEDYKKEIWTVEYPDGHKEKYDFRQLEEKYNELKDERTKVSAELADVLKPVTEANNKVTEYVSAHLVDLTPSQIEGLQKKTSEWDPTIQQINVAEANIVDRCESCHMGIREPLKLTAASMTTRGQKRPDEYAQAFVSHPEPEILKIHDPDKFGCSPCHQGNGRATTSAEKAHGNYEHWLWPLYPKENSQAGCQTCHSGDMVLVSGDVQFQTINDGKDLYRQRGCMGCHRYEGYDREPEDLNSVGQQIKQIETQ